MGQRLNGVNDQVVQFMDLTRPSKRATLNNNLYLKQLTLENKAYKSLR